MSESDSSALDVNSAAAIFASQMEPAEAAPEKEVKQPEAEAPEAQATEAEAEEEPEDAEGNPEEEPQKFTIKVDGKDVELTESEIAEHYKSGLRQSDYTKKTMEVAEARKAAEAETQKAQQERTQYAQKLHSQETLLHAVLQEQSQTNWQELLANDPVEYLQQKHLYDQRQAALQSIHQEKAQLVQQHQAEQKQAYDRFVAQQREELIAKLPEWADPVKSKAEQTAVTEFLKGNGFSAEEIDSIVDARHVVVARKAMLYDKMMEKAQAAAKKVSTLPQKVEKPGVSETRTLDKRSSAFQKLSKSGSIDDAAAVFRGLL